MSERIAISDFQRGYDLGRADGYRHGYGQAQAIALMHPSNAVASPCGCVIAAAYWHDGENIVFACCSDPRTSVGKNI